MYGRKKKMGLQEFLLKPGLLRSRFIDWNNETAAARNGINDNDYIDNRCFAYRKDFEHADSLEMFSAKERDRYEE